MRIVSMAIALAALVACSSSDVNKDAGSGPVVGKWTLQTYNGRPLPFTGSTNANGSVNRVDSGSITFDAAKTYLLDIRIVNTLGTKSIDDNFAEVGSWSGNPSTGIALKPNDISGGSSGQPLPQVPVNVSGNTLSFLQDGKVLTFGKQ